MILNFTKMQSAGNDFIVIDNRHSGISRGYSKLAKKLCQRPFSIGADGLLVIEDSKTADFKMLIFNPDGSQAEMCGNGGRCIAYYAYLNKIAPRKMSFETLAGKISAEIKNREVKLQMTDPHNIRLNFQIPLNPPLIKGEIKKGDLKDVSFINTGVPHTVLFCSNLDAVDVNKIGRAIRYHSKFAPAGTNVNFVRKSKNSKNTLYVRTYERGVEQETYACGTGAVASAVIAGLKNIVSSPVKCRTSGGEILKVSFSISGKNVHNVYLEGPVKVSFTGKINI